jgi:surfactin synthase thioesterase subunit
MPPPSECEGPALTLEHIAEQCLKELSSQELGSFVLYGHCAGTALVVELASVSTGKSRTHCPQIVSRCGNATWIFKIRSAASDHQN